MRSYLNRRELFRATLAVASVGFPCVVNAESPVNSLPNQATREKHDFVVAAMKENDEAFSRRLAELARSGIHPFMIVSTLMPFGDWDFYYVKGGSISWGPDTGGDMVKIEVTVPEGFVTDLASIPRAFWSIRRPEGRHAFAAVVHDYLYWTQIKTREESDSIFRQAMLDSKLDKSEVEVLYQAVRQFGSAAWEGNKKLKATGEKRLLKVLPTDYTTSWSDWKKQPGVFQD